MHLLLLSALALAPTDLPEYAPIDDWSSLDAEIANLSSTYVAADDTAPKISGWLKIDQFWSDFGNSGSLFGTALASARLNFSGKVGDFAYKLQIDGSSGATGAGFGGAAGTGGNVSLKDAWASYPISENLKFQFGRFKAPFLFTSMVSDDREVFWDRTFQGEIWNGRDQGVQLIGNYDHFRAWGNMQNGGDGVADDLMWNVNAAWDLVAGKGLGSQEGGYGVDATTNVTVAAGYLDEGALDDGGVINAQAIATIGGFYLQGEVVSYGDGFTPQPATFVGISRPAAQADLAGSTGWDVTGAWQFNEKWQAALRYQDTDTQDTQILSVGLNWFVAGWGVQWIANYDHVKSDNSAIESDRVLVGLVVDF